MSSESTLKRAASEEPAYDESTEQRRDVKKIKVISITEEPAKLLKDPDAIRQIKTSSVVYEIEKTVTAQQVCSDVRALGSSELPDPQHNGTSKAAEIHAETAQETKPTVDETAVSKDDQQISKEVIDLEWEAKLQRILNGEEEYLGYSDEKEGSSRFEEGSKAEYDDKPYGSGPVLDRNQGGAWIRTASAEPEIDLALAPQDDALDAHFDEYEEIGLAEDKGTETGAGEQR
ncbi:hypothetical protein EJ02DRAFT_464457 [Clathrospora elynae]|uniref:Uncharacterized protein n=1 Tax=Clathrospora elynae TaxID=706981 RepID=A0A6A5SUH7_9PLEO|nr:hypothetical protein EJ02DRAFT_464457 [Clathrospora elynae]